MKHDHYDHRERYTGCYPTMLCGRKVWLVTRGMHDVPEIWVHTSPWRRPIAYLVGTSLTEGDEAANTAYLESLVAKKLLRCKAISGRLEQIWDDEMAEAAADYPSRDDMDALDADLWAAEQQAYGPR